MTATLGAALRAGGEALVAVAEGAPRREAELLLMEASGLPRERLIAWPEQELPEDILARYWGLVDRRRAGEPMAYIRGRQAFWDVELVVGPATLIPRPDTELLVELTLAWLPADAPLVVVDAGTGTGAIAVALARERPGWTLLALEASPEACGLAQGNLRRLSPGNTRLIRCDWLDAIGLGSLDAVIGNPPYLALGDPHLARGDLRFEPPGALVAGVDGLDAIRRLAGQAATRLRPGALLALEHGFAQGEAVRGVYSAMGYERISTQRDLGGRDRVTIGWRPFAPSLPPASRVG